jgi:hypothetical protein
MTAFTSKPTYSPFLSDTRGRSLKRRRLGEAPLSREVSQPTVDPTARAFNAPSPCRTLGARQHGSVQIRSRQIGASELSAGQVGVRQVGSKEAGARQIRPGEIGEAEIDLPRVRSVRLAQDKCQTVSDLYVPKSSPTLDTAAAKRPLFLSIGTERGTLSVGIPCPAIFGDRAGSSGISGPHKLESSYG